MIFLKTFNEKLGISDDVLTLADELYDKLKNKSIIETRFNGKKLVVMIDPKCTLKGKFSHMIGTNGLYYQIVLSELDKSTLVHEIKHMFRNSKVSGRGRKDFIPTKSEELSAKYNTVFELEKRLFDSKWYHNKKYYKVFTDVKRLFDNEDYSEFGKKLSFLIHKNANRNYRKLMRIYSLFNHN